MKKYLTGIDWKDLAERALWTFVEAALASLPITLSLEMDGAAWKSILFSAAVSGLSALKTFIIDIARQRLEQKKAEALEEEQEAEEESRLHLEELKRKDALNAINYDGENEAEGK